MKKRILALILILVLMLSSCDLVIGGGGNTGGGSGGGGSGGNNGGSGGNNGGGAGDGTGGETVNTVCTDGGKHRDENDDGICDVCDGAVIVVIDILAINDLHGKFSDSDGVVGVGGLTTYIKNAKAKNPYTVLLSSGDMWQGSTESNATRGKIITEWMNSLSFVSMTLGNHEFDWGRESIAENAALADFPLLAINVIDTSTNERPAYLASSVTFSVAGLTVSVIGAIGDCYSSISGEQNKGIRFATGSELTSLVKAEATRLRESGSDIILYSLHDGYENSASGIKEVSDYEISSYYQTALSDGYVDMVFEGHTHKSYTLLDSRGVYHFQNGGENRGMSHAGMRVNIANGKRSVTTAEIIPQSTYAACDTDPIVDELTVKYQEKIAPVYRYLGKNDRRRDGDELRQLTANLYYLAGTERWGARYNIVLGGGYMSVRSPYYLFAGDLKYSDIYPVFPFDNALVLCSVEGRYLRSQFFETSNTNYFIGYGQYGESVRTSIDDNRTYYIVTDTYSSTYAPNRLTEIERYDNVTFGRDLIADYAGAGGFTYTPTGGVYENFTITPIDSLLERCASLPLGYIAPEQVYIRGEIVSVAGTAYGNMTIRDDSGAEIYVYGLYSADGSTVYGSLPDESRPAVGDTVTITGKLYYYRSGVGMTPTPEIMHACIVEYTK